MEGPVRFVDSKHYRIEAEEIARVLAAGLFDSASRAILLYRQETIHRTRETLLHEATHQFHLLGLPGGRGATAWWHREGLAEHLERHLWDGERLHLGVAPTIGHLSLPPRACGILADHRFDLGRFIDGHPRLEPELQVLEIGGHRLDAGLYRYGEAYALVRYLLPGNGG